MNAECPIIIHFRRKHQVYPAALPFAHQQRSSDSLLPSLRSRLSQLDGSDPGHADKISSSAVLYARREEADVFVYALCIYLHFFVWQPFPSIHIAPSCRRNTRKGEAPTEANHFGGIQLL